jgi:hypothetical protein
MLKKENNTGCPICFKYRKSGKYICICRMRGRLEGAKKEQDKWLNCLGVKSEDEAVYLLRKIDKIVGEISRVFDVELR